MVLAICMCAFINYLFIALKEVLQENGVPGRGLDFQPTVTPALSYDLTTPPYATPQLKYKPKTTERKVRDFSVIRSKAEKSIEDGIQALEKEYYMLDW